MKLHYIAASGVQSNINDYIYMSEKPRSKAQLGIYNTNKWMNSKYDLWSWVECLCLGAGIHGLNEHPVTHFYQIKLYWLKNRTGKSDRKQEKLHIKQGG